MTGSLASKHIIVTGASSGIGRAAAVMLAARGAELLLVARDEAALGDVAGAIRAAGGRAEICRADVGKLEDTKAYVGRAQELWDGVIDGLFANAGMGGPVSSLWDYPLDGFDEVLAVNLKSLFWALQLVLPGMIERRAGSVVATGSLASERGLPMTSGYNVSKHAVLGLVRSAASEVARHGVRVNALIPGLIETRMLTEIAAAVSEGDVAAGLANFGRMSPQGRVGTAEEAAAIAAFLLSDEATYVNGQAIAADGGMLATITNSM